MPAPAFAHLLSEDLFKAIFQQSRHPLAVVDTEQFEVVEANDAFKLLLIPNQHSASQLKLDQLLPLSSSILNQLRALRRSGQVNYGMEVTLGDSLTSSTWLWLQFHALPPADSGLVLIDIDDKTDLRRSEEKRLSTQNRTRAQDDALVEIASDPTLHSGDLSVALRKLTLKSSIVLDVDRVSVWQMDLHQDHATCVCLYDRRTGEFSEGASLKKQDYPSYFGALKFSRFISANNARTDPRTREFLDGYLLPNGIFSMLDTPIRIQGQLAGLVCIEACHVPREWTLGEQTYCASVGDLACLAFTAHRHRQLEAQLRHMMKMESVGRLAGGIAHDFNNIIQAINGYTTMLLEESSVGPDAKPWLHEMKIAAERAMKLTGKLLTMSRKQQVRLEPLCLNKTILDLEPMLTKLLPKHFSLQLQLAPSLPPTAADCSMIEQVIMNLVVNARDAMEQSPSPTPRIVISTRVQNLAPLALRQHPEARAGTFVVAAVTDQGCGMDESTLSRLFEPFFTTKPVGRGTGLGLSIVYGIIKQHEGWIEVASKLGEGTTFSIYLPILDPEVLANNETKRE